MDLDPATATAGQLGRAISERELSSRELLDHLLDRAGKINPQLNAIVAWDTERARAAADAADQATMRGEIAGPLHGLPMTVKDLFETEGLVTTAGATELAGHVPSADAIPVSRLKAAGAIVFGKSNTPRYGSDLQTDNQVYGRTNNPWDPARTAGGSSGGAAAAVAAGLTPLELGSDIGGSIRNPSHYNGVYGLKPSWGIVPSRGHIPGPPGSLTEADVGVTGPIARCVADLRTVLGLVSGPRPQDAAGWRLELDAGPDRDGVAGLRVATVFGAGEGVLPLAGDVRALLDGFAARLAGAGAQVSEVPLPVPLADGFGLWRDLVMPIIGLGLTDEMYAEFSRLEDVPGDNLGLVNSKAMASRYRTWMGAVERREQQREVWSRFFGGWDVLLAPVMPTTAYPHDTERPMPERLVDIDGVAVPNFSMIAWCGAIGSVLLPVVTVPAGVTADGLPAGVQIAGPFLSDLRLLRLAELIDAAAGPGFTPPPSLAS
jgi:amidase